ncbi:MAG: thiamine phosphate synthase [Pseudomonadota bacterium]
MSDAPEHPQLYVITPPGSKLGALTKEVAKVLDAAPVACVRLSTGGDSADDISRAADIVRELCHQRDIAIVIDGHPGLVEPLGLDGVHLAGPAKQLRDAKKQLGGDAILGAYVGQSRHDGLTAGEIGADYVSFGPVGETGLGDVDFVEPELFQWWSMMIELPIVAEGGVSLTHAETLAPHVDFVALGSELWSVDAPADMIQSYAERLAI